MGKLIMFNSDGKNIGIFNTNLTEVIDKNKDIIDKNKEIKFDLFKEYNLELECRTKLDLFTYYELLYGIKITNNYLKMNGGIMRRRRWLK